MKAFLAGYDTSAKPRGLLEPPGDLARACRGALGKFQAFLIPCTRLLGQTL